MIRVTGGKTNLSTARFWEVGIGRVRTRIVKELNHITSFNLSKSNEIIKLLPNSGPLRLEILSGF